MIEPAAFGVATCFGPKTRNFRDVVQLLLSRAAAVVVSDQMELTSHVRRCAADIDYRRELGIRAMETVLQQTGAADRTVNMLAGLLHPRGATLPGTENYDASTQNKPRAGYRRTA